MTEVAQVAAVVAHDMGDVTNEDEHNMSDAENKEDDMAHEEDDAVVDEDEENEKASHMEDKKPRHMNDEAGDETDKTRVNGVKHKGNDTADEKNERSEAVNGVAQDTEKKLDASDTNEDQNISDFALKKEVSEE